MAETKATWTECSGEAHSNPHVDNCMVCMPWWGRYPVCPTCQGKLMQWPPKRRTSFVCRTSNCESFGRTFEVDE